MCVCIREVLVAYTANADRRKRREIDAKKQFAIVLGCALSAF